MQAKQKWWQKTVVYQVYPKSFKHTTGSGQGDIPGITRRLDYLKTLGVGAVWLTPVYPSPMVDNGYDIADYTAIDPSYGTMADMEELIAEGKRCGIRIVMDLVFNHSSDQHPWFLESKSSRDNAKADWYIWRDAKPDGSAPTNWRGIFGGSAWTWCEERQQYYLHTFAKEQPDLNWENPAVRQALYDAANFWLDKGVGGFRIDAIVYIKKPAFVDGEPDGEDGMVGIHEMTHDTPGILDFLHEFKANVFDGHDIFTVGEANGVAASELKDWVGENGVFSMLFEFSHMNLNFPTSERWYEAEDWPLSKLKGALTASQSSRRTPTRCSRPRPWPPCSLPCAARPSSTRGRSSATPMWPGRASTTTMTSPRTGNMRSHSRRAVHMSRRWRVFTASPATTRARRCSGATAATPVSRRARRGCRYTTTTAAAASSTRPATRTRS